MESKKNQKKCWGVKVKKWVYTVFRMMVPWEIESRENIKLMQNWVVVGFGRIFCCLFCCKHMLIRSYKVIVHQQKSYKVSVLYG